MFSGEKAAIDAALMAALGSAELNTSTSFLDVVPELAFDVNSHQGSLAYYDAVTIPRKYKAVGEKMAKDETRAEGFSLLP
jgi:hypothetical protein